MKKFYSLLAASAVVFAASASDNTDQGSKLGSFKAPTHRQASGLSDSYRINPEVKKSIVSARKADEVPSLEGEWNFLVMDYYMEGATFSTKYVSYEAEVNGDMITFTDPTGRDYSIIGQIFPQKQKITFSKTYLGLEDGYKMFQDPFIFNGETGEVEYQPIDAYYNVEGEMITFNGNYYGIFWNAYNDEAGENLAGPYYAYDFITGTQPIPGEWNDVGNATFMDGWILPGFGINQASNQYEVPLQQNSDNPYLFRLVNPYKRGPVAQSNSSKKNGYITFDVYDPEHVVFKFGDCGFSFKDVPSNTNINNFFCYNYLSGTYYFNLDMTIPEIIEYLKIQGAPFSTFKDGVLNVTGTFPNGAPDACFGIDQTALWCLTWENNMTTRITFPESFAAVESVAMDNENAPVEYFNLQGVRIQNPLPGQIVITRQGNKVTKSIAK